MNSLTIAFACDHRGFSLKSVFLRRLAEHGHKVVDLGTNNENACDATDFAARLVEDLRKNPGHRGVLVCGSGQAMAITANRYKHIRAALCLNTTMARLAREHNDANVLVLGSHIIGQEVALDCLDVFLKTEYLGGKYQARLDKLNALGGL